MALQFLDNMCFNFISKLTATDTLLPVSNSDKAVLCGALAAGDHTYLTVSSPTGTEIVRVTCVGGDIVIERAQGGTAAMAHSMGRCACFKVNKLILDEYNNGGVTEACIPTFITNQPDFVEITPPADGECEWTIDICSDIVDCIEDMCVDNCDPCVLPDGTYENATLTIRNGKVCGVSNGTNIVYTGGSCCGCSSCQPETDEVIVDTP